MNHLTGVVAVSRLADMAQGLDMDNDALDALGTCVTQGTPAPAHMDALLYAAALARAAELVDMPANDLMDMVLDELASRDERCTCADEVSLVRSLCGIHES